MNSYQASSGRLDLGALASGSVIFALNNPTGSGVNLIIKRLSCKLGFVGTPAATTVPIGIGRATGTPAGGTTAVISANVAKRNPGNPTSKATLNYGPAAITGLTPDTPADFKTTFINHQTGSPVWDEPIDDIKDILATDPLIIAPGTSLYAITRALSVAGSGVSFDVEWSEM